MEIYWIGNETCIKLSYADKASLLITVNIDESSTEINLIYFQENMLMIRVKGRQEGYQRGWVEFTNRNAGVIGHNKS